MAVRYELIVGVVAKCHSFVLSAGLPASVPSAVRSARSSVDSTGMFDSTVHDCGAFTLNLNVAFRSGWSNTA